MAQTTRIASFGPVCKHVTRFSWTLATFAHNDVTLEGSRSHYKRLAFAQLEGLRS